MRSAEWLLAEDAGPEPAAVPQTCVHVHEWDDKLDILARCILPHVQPLGQVLILSRRWRYAEVVHRYLKARGIPAGLLHGDLSDTERGAVVSFRRDRSPLLM